MGSHNLLRFSASVFAVILKGLWRIHPVRLTAPGVFFFFSFALSFGSLLVMSFHENHIFQVPQHMVLMSYI